MNGDEQHRSAISSSLRQSFREPLPKAFGTIDHQQIGVSESGEVSTDGPAKLAHRRTTGRAALRVVAGGDVEARPRPPRLGAARDVRHERALARAMGPANRAGPNCFERSEDLARPRRMLIGDPGDRAGSGAFETEGIPGRPRPASNRLIGRGRACRHGRWSLERFSGWGCMASSEMAAGPRPHDRAAVRM